MKDETNAGKVCLVDLDGTLCDLEGSLRARLAEMASPDDLPLHEAPDLHTAEDAHRWFKARSDAVKSLPGFWESLAEMPDGFDVLRAARDAGFRVHVLTQGPRSKSHAWSEKVRWFQAHVLPVVPEADVTVTRDKGLVYGRVLVDDWPAYARRWLRWRPSGLVLMPDRPYNQDFVHPQVVRYTAGSMVDYARVSNALQTAFDRE